MKKIIAGITLLCLLAPVLAGCGGKTEPVQEPVGDETNTAAETVRTVIDHDGDEVALPETIERVVITSPWPLPSVYGLYMGSGAKIVGVHPAVKSAAENSLLMKIAPEIADAETGFMNGSDINIEELMKLEPDVVFIGSGNDEQKEACIRAGIPVVTFSTSIAQFNSVETVYEWVSLLGQIFGDELKSDEITAFGREIESLVSERIADIPQEDKPRILMLYQYKDGNMQTSGSKHFGQYWIDATGGINVAGEIEQGGVSINMEQVYEWNPDMIYVTNFSPYLVEDFINNAIEGDDWSSLEAVQQGEVYKFPLGMYRWYPPSSDSPLTLLWLAKNQYPELFADIDLEQEIKDYYVRFYDVELTDEDIYSIMNPPREAADGV